MINNEFLSVAMKNELTPGKIKDFFDRTSLNDIKETLHHLTLKASPDEEDWHGLPSDIPLMLHEMNMPDALFLYIRHYICKCERVHPKLSYDDFKWLVEKTNLGGKEAIINYMSTLQLSDDQQMVVYDSDNMDLWEVMCQKQKIEPKVQEQLLRDHHAFNGERFDRADTKLRIYIKNCKFCEDAERSFLNNPAPYKIEYVQLHGLSQQMRDEMLLDIWLKFYK